MNLLVETFVSPSRIKKTPQESKVIKRETWKQKRLIKRGLSKQYKIAVIKSENVNFDS